ncbi:MAG: CstA-like transporter-associated (seleno)protein [Sphingobium sp.]|uniref:YbdD/YjiX family protein n=1 Tax=Sphingobium sp. TaxID=1912891 RepID=UPI002E1F28E1
MTGVFETLRRTARLMVGIPDYDAYLRHMADHHPDHPVMDRTQFFRDRQQARYGGKNGGRCC